MDKKSILITGCSRGGIGYDSALVLKERGYRVFATARKEEEIHHLKELGFEAYQLDVTITQHIDSVIEQILNINNNKLYAIFNNAGYGQAGALEDIPSYAFKEQFETNVFGLHYLTCKVIPIMREQGYGKIIQHSSILGLISLKFRGAYNASKYAIEGLCDTWRLELADTDIDVVSLNTGPVRSRFRINATKMFDLHVNKESSYFKDEYANDIKRREESKGDDAFTKDSDVVIDALIHSLEGNTKARYHITLATKLLAGFKRVLPTKTLDKVLVKIS